MESERQVLQWPILYPLGEQIATLIGFAGALIVLRPDIELGFGPLLILCASLMGSSSMLMAITLTKTDTISSITFWQAAGLIPATFILDDKGIIIATRLRGSALEKKIDELFER